MTQQCMCNWGKTGQVCACCIDEIEMDNKLNEKYTSKDGIQPRASNNGRL